MQHVFTYLHTKRTRFRAGTPRAASKGRRLSCLVLAGVALVALSSCERPQIERYQAHKAISPPRSSQSTTQRLLGAMIPHRERIWFFKLAGSSEAINQHTEAFERFIRSVRFTDQDEPPIAWDVPKNWHHHAGSGMRYAEFHLGEHDREPLVLTVTALGPEAGSVLENVNRWAGQIGLPPMNETQLQQITQTVKLEDATVTLVDLTGPGTPGSASPPPLTGGSLPATPLASGNNAPRRPISFTTPQGWAEQAAGGMRVAAFEVSEGAQKALVTVIPLSGTAGGLAPNINRWRGEIGLEPLGEQDVHTLEVAGAAASYVDLIGPESAGPQRERTLGVIAVREGGRTWFFKMRGAAALVEKQKSAFEAWVRSVQFEAESPNKGGNDG